MGKDLESLDGVLLDYRPSALPGENSYETYLVRDARNKGVIRYAVDGIVEKIEGAVVTSPTDPLYRASSGIAKRITKDRTTGSVVALGLYYFLKGFAEKFDNESTVKRLGD